MHRFFYAIYCFIERNKTLSVAFFGGLLLAMGFVAYQIKFTEDITKLIPVSNDQEPTVKVLQQLNFADKITVTIAAQDDAGLDDLSEYANVFLDTLNQSCGPYIKDVQGQVDEANLQQTIDFAYNNLPLFLEEKDYQALALRLSQDSIAATVRSNYKSIVSPSGLVAKDFILKDPLGISFVALKKLQQLNLGDEFEIQNGFVVTKDHKNLLLFINPKLASTETHQNTVFAQKLYGIRDALNARFQAKAQATYFGSALIAVANATQIKQDISLSMSVAMAALLLILILFYRKLLIPIIIFVPTLFGAAFSIALLYVLKGTISAISLGIGSILIGITIDYALHILTHYKHNSDAKALYKDITTPLIMSSSTTAIAFLCLIFVHSEALRDLGIFAAAITLSSAFFSLLLVPHLYRPNKNTHAATVTWIDRLGGFSFHRNRYLIGCCLLIIFGCFFTFNKVRFNNDLSQLNYIPPELQAAEKALEQNTNLTSKTIYLASYGLSEDEVLQANNKLFERLSKAKSQGKIKNFSSVGGIVFPVKVQQAKIARWNAFWTPERQSDLQNNLVAEGAKIGFKPGTYSRFYERLQMPFEPVGVQEYLSLSALNLQEFLNQKNGLYTAATLVKVNGAQRRPLIALAKATPNVLAIDRQEMNENFLGNLKTDFNRLVNYSFLAVLLILILFFRRIELVLVSAIPIVVTGFVTAGIMGFFNIGLNVFSTIVCTLVFGHGVDFSIFMTSALQKQYTDGKDEIAVYRTSILLAVITTILGIGALIFAEHPALQSISAVSLIGVFSAVAITFIFYPILFRLAITGRAAKGKAPFQFLTLIHSVLSFLYFGLGGLLFSLASLVLRILPFPSEATKMRWFRFHMSKLMKSVLYTNYFVKKRLINIPNESFQKPAVIIANHTSFLDILAVGMLSPKTIYLVSDWVYNSPIFGKAVRWAGFYPVSEGIEGGVEHLRKKVAEGYSLIVFPEGTRSRTNQIQRFHKGAFYLAEHFNLDILPVVIHGNSEALPKGDFIIYDGWIAVSILERITPDDKRFGDNYTQRTKQITAFFRDQYDKMRHEHEGPDYFKKILINSYDYKTPEVVQAVKTDLRRNLETYHVLNRFIDKKANILHLANDYGQLDVLLSLQEPQRKIISWIADEKRRAVAKTNYFLQKRSIRYLESALEAENDKYDVLLISDTDYNSEIAAQTETIILLGVFVPDLQFADFENTHATNQFAVLKRKK